MQCIIPCVCREHESYQGVMLKRPGHWVDEETGVPVLNPRSPEDGGFASGHPFVSGHINGHGNFGDNNLKPYVFNGMWNMFRLFGKGVCGTVLNVGSFWSRIKLCIYFSRTTSVVSNGVFVRFMHNCNEISS